jgi:hypothetical protein
MGNKEELNWRYEEISNENFLKLKNIIVSEGVPIFRRDDRNAIVPVKEEIINAITSSKTPKFTLFIEKEKKSRLEFKAQKAAASHTVKSDDSIMESVKQYGDVDQQVDKFNDLTIVQREEILDESIYKLHKIEGISHLNINALTDMVDVIANTFYSNHATLNSGIKNLDAKETLSGIYQKTDWIIKILIEIFKDKVGSSEDLIMIDKINTGSFTLDHLTRVLLQFINFCIFYNEYIDKGLITKAIRPDFSKKYKRYYEKLYPASNLSLEAIFKNGIRRLNLETEMPVYATGALLFDIGKITDIYYHDGEHDFDKNLVQKHVLYSYNMIVKAKVYPFAVALISAFHHEYYGGDKSYKFTNAILSRVLKKKVTDEKWHYFISFDENDFINRNALAFFPCKVLEIIDIYDALVYKKRKSVYDALTVMKKDFITRSLKIDPVLFRIFLEYKLRAKYITLNEKEAVDNIIY